MTQFKYALPLFLLLIVLSMIYRFDNAQPSDIDVVTLKPHAVMSTDEKDQPTIRPDQTSPPVVLVQASDDVIVRNADIIEIGERRLKGIIDAYQAGLTEYFYDSYLIEVVGFTRDNQPIIDITDLNTFTEKATLALGRRFFFELDNLNESDQFGEPSLANENTILDYFKFSDIADDSHIEIIFCRQKKCMLSISSSDSFDLRAFEKQLTTIGQQCYLQRWLTIEGLQQISLSCQ